MTVTSKKHAPSLRFPGFAEEWCNTTIGQNFEFKNGLNKEKEYFGHGTPIINFMDVYRLTAIRKKHINGLVELSDKEIANFSIRKGDVFFTRTSETINDIGMSATLVEDIENCVFSGFVLRARPINKKLGNLYKSYCFSIEPVRKEIVTKSSYTTRALTSGRLLNKACFYYPSDLQEQQKIASFLSSVDTKIEQLGKKKALLEQYQKGMMQKLFSQEIRFRDEQGNDYPDWERKKLGDLYEFKSTNSFSREKLNYIEGWVRNIHYGDIHTKYKARFTLNEETVPFVNSNVDVSNIREDLFCQEGDLVIADASEDYSEIGKTIELIALNNQRVLAGLHTLLARRISSDISTGYGSYMMSCSRVKLQIKRIAQGTKVLGISASRMKEIELPLPSEIEQQKIANFLSAIDKKIELVAEQLEQARTFKKGLLQKMFI